MKTILHVDMNAYFASVEQASNPFLKGKPIAVGGGVGGKRTVVAACSYEAKARGISNAMSAWDAKKICPELIIVAGNMDKYAYTSCRIMDILREFTPLVQVFSIDEAFMDVTETKERYGGEEALAKEIKKRIREKFNLTCSIGISYNKLMAKFAGELKKPDGLTILWPDDIPDKIKEVPVSKLCGVGRKIEKYLAELRIKTFGDLNIYPREKFIKRFGVVYGEQLYQMGQGRDSSEVSPDKNNEAAKSMGHSYTLPKATADIEKIKSYLMRLSEQVGRRLRRDGYKGNVVHLSLGFGNFNFWGKQKKVEDHMDDGYEIYKVAEKLLDATLFREPFRFVGISISNLTQGLDQVSIFENKERNKKILKAVDEINDRYGEFKIERLSILKTILSSKTGFVARKQK